MSHLQSLNKGLELKIIELQKKLTKEEFKNAQLLATNEDLRIKFENNVTHSCNELIELQNKMEQVSIELTEERNRSVQLEKELHQIIEEQKETDILHQQVNLALLMIIKLNRK